MRLSQPISIVETGQAAYASEFADALEPLNRFIDMFAGLTSCLVGWMRDRASPLRLIRPSAD